MAGFFPPEPLCLAGQEQVTDQGDPQVTTQRLVGADFKVRHAQFALFVFQAALDGPAGESHVEDGFQSGVRTGSRVGQEKLFLLGMEYVAGLHQPVGTMGNAVALQPEMVHGFDLPHHGAFVGVLDVEALPRLVDHGPGMLTQVLDAARGIARCRAGVVEPTL